MMAEPLPDIRFVLATGCVEPDCDFASIEALARALVERRDRICRGARPALSVRPAIVARSELPGGWVLAVRARDGSNNGHGAVIGYVFMPKADLGGEARTLSIALNDAGERLVALA